LIPLALDVERHEGKRNPDGVGMASVIRVLPIAVMCWGCCEDCRVLAFIGRLASSRIPAGEWASEAAIYFVITMATVTFRVIPQKNCTYYVELVRPDGSRRTITGFRSEHEAQAWGVQAERMIKADRSWLTRPAASPRTQAVHWSM
jgi:hypothetical protein